MSDSAEFSISRPRPVVAPPPVRLTNWPLVYERRLALVLLGISLLAAVVVGQSTGSLAWAAVSLVALLFSTWRCWVPVTYELGSAGITRWIFRQQQVFPWSQFVRYEVNQKTVLLIRDVETTPLVRFRALYLYGGEQQSQLLDLLEYYLPPAESAR